jgi:4-amino-4-deoxy-L-arabinose transferase-like glycosyltransferase
MRSSATVWPLLLAGILLGCTLRFWAPGRLGVEHFDEGVYASNLWFDAEAGYRYPNRPLYAPPLVPFLIECSLLVFGAQGFAAIIPNLAAGCATIALVWWTGREWFGPAAGLAAAALAATCEVHVLYSRTALTDVMLCFWWLAAVAVAERAFRLARLDLAVAAGALAGLAWWTKYNGWLAIGVAIGGAACWLLVGRGDRKQAGRVALAAALLAVTALAVWAPVLMGLESSGGYAAVAENHAKYFVGLGGWLSTARSQLATLWSLDGPWSFAGLALAFFAAAVVVRGQAASGDSARGRGPGVWMLLVWFVGLTFATPLYYPYPRLALPWIVAVWLGIGAAIGRLAERGKTGERATDARIAGACIAAGVVAMFAAIGMGIADFQAGEGSSAWQPHTGLESVAAEIVKDLAPAAADDATPVVFVYAEPALLFHLNAAQFGAANQVAVAPAGTLDFGEVPLGAAVYLAAGFHAFQSAEFTNALNKNAGQFVLREEYPYLASDLVLSDHFPPAAWGHKRQQAVNLYRVK